MDTRPGPRRDTLLSWGTTEMGKKSSKLRAFLVAFAPVLICKSSLFGCDANDGKPGEFFLAGQREANLPPARPANLNSA